MFNCSSSNPLNHLWLRLLKVRRSRSFSGFGNGSKTDKTRPQKFLGSEPNCFLRSSPGLSCSFRFKETKTIGPIGTGPEKMVRFGTRPEISDSVWSRSDHFRSGSAQSGLWAALPVMHRVVKGGIACITGDARSSQGVKGSPDVHQAQNEIRYQIVHR